MKLPDKDQPTKALKISLSDCLACVGCLSAEEQILVTNSSNIDTLKQSLNVSDRTNIAIISPQSVASFALKYGFPTNEMTFKFLSDKMKILGNS